MTKSCDSSVKSIWTYQSQGTTKGGEPREGPEDLHFVLLCLDYLRDLRRTNKADHLRHKKRIDADYLSLAIFALSRSVLRPDYLTNEVAPRDIFDQKVSGSDHHKIPHISEINQEVLSPASQLRPYDENYDDLHPSNLYRFYPLDGLASGPQDGPLGLDELVLSGLKSIGARCRLDAERDIVKSKHFEHYIQSVNARGYFHDPANSGKRKDPKEEEARKRLKVRVYKEKYRRAIAKYRQKLALELENGTKEEILSLPASPGFHLQTVEERSSVGMCSPPRNGRLVGGNVQSPTRNISPMSPLTPNTAGPYNPAFAKFSTCSPLPTSPGKTRLGSAVSAKASSYRNTPVNKQFSTSSEAPSEFTPGNRSHPQSMVTPNTEEVTAKSNQYWNTMMTMSDPSKGIVPVLESHGSQRKMASAEISFKNKYEEKLTSSGSSDSPETRYEGPVLPKLRQKKIRSYSKDPIVPDITEPRPRSLQSCTRGEMKKKLSDTSTDEPGNVAAKQPGKDPKTSCTSPVARLRGEKEQVDISKLGGNGTSTAMTSPRRSKVNSDGSWIKEGGKTLSLGSRAVHGRLHSNSATKNLRLDPFQLAPPKCFSRLGTARVFTAQGVEWGSTTNLSSPRSLQMSPRARTSPHNICNQAQRRGVC